MTRNYNFADAKLLEHTSVVLEALKTDLPEFLALDSDLNETLVASLGASYTTTL